MKEHNSKNGIFSDDKIQYVYFRDKGGNLNAGYISTELLYEYYGLDELQNCAVYRGGDYGMDGQVYYGCNEDSDYNYEFILKNKLKSYGKNREYIATLPVGTKIRLPKNAVTDGIYANRIQVSEKLLPNSSTWTSVDSNNSYGYIDLGFEFGVLPKDRPLITSSSTSFEHRKNSVIYFLPGYMGSQLYDSETNELVWVNQNFPGPLKNDVLGHVLPTWSPLIGLDENGNGDKLKVSRELDIQNGVYGTDFDGDSAKAIMDNLNNSFSENYSIEFFAYDWRKDLKLVEQQLRDDIQKKGYNNHRKNNISLVFQNYNLIDYLTPIENIRLVNKSADESILFELGLDKKQIKRNVMKLSGGQQQRVAIARALVSNAPIILADEPTGNLDSVTAGEIIDILKTLAKDKNKCVIVVTHSKEVADSADIILELSGKNLKKVNKMNLEVE